MSMRNMCLFVGKLVRDVELRDVNGSQVAKFGLMLSEQYKKRDSKEVVRETIFVDVEAWGPRAAVINQYFKKGDWIQVHATMKEDVWKDKNTGAERKKFKFRLEDFAFIPTPKPQGEELPSDAGEESQVDNVPANKSDEIPF